MRNDFYPLRFRECKMKLAWQVFAQNYSRFEDKRKIN